MTTAFINTLNAALVAALACLGILALLVATKSPDSNRSVQDRRPRLGA